jgi:hypothetical protein
MGSLKLSLHFMRADALIFCMRELVHATAAMAKSARRLCGSGGSQQRDIKGIHTAMAEASQGADASLTERRASLSGDALRHDSESDTDAESAHYSDGNESDSSRPRTDGRQTLPQFLRNNSATLAVSRQGLGLRRFSTRASSDAATAVNDKFQNSRQARPRVDSGAGRQSPLAAKLMDGRGARNDDVVIPFHRVAEETPTDRHGHVCTCDDTATCNRASQGMCTDMPDEIRASQGMCTDMPDEIHGSSQRLLQDEQDEERAARVHRYCCMCGCHVAADVNHQNRGSSAPG